MTRLGLIMLTFLLFSIASFAQSDDTTTEYDYITVMVDEKRPYKYFISYSDGIYEEKEFKPEGKFDFTGLLSIISEKESEGYELCEFSTFVTDMSKPHMFYLLRKKKN